MNTLTSLRWIVAALIIGLLAAGSAGAESLSVGVRTDNLSLGIRIGSPPPLVVAPGTPVSHAPSIDHNYFFHGGRYYLYHREVWLSAGHHDGPWTVIALELEGFWPEATALASGTAVL